MSVTYWTSANSGAGVLKNTTTGDNQTPDPVRFPGSSVGAIPAGYITSAQAVYPVRDGVTSISGVRQTLAINPLTGSLDYSRYPSTFWSNYTTLVSTQNDIANGVVPTPVMPTPTLASNPSDFTNWHSAFQAEYIDRLPRTVSADPAEYVIGTSVTTASAIYMLDDQNRPVNLLALTLADFAKLSSTEKTRFLPNLTDSGHLAKLGLSTDDDERDDLVSGTGDISKPGLDEYLLTISDAPSAVTSDMQLLFSTQIQMLKDEVNVSGSAFNADAIREAATEIMTRFNILKTFVTAVRPASVTIVGYFHLKTGSGIIEFGPESATTSTLVKKQVNTLDGGDTMDKGIAAFIKAETEILNMKERRAVIAANSAYRDPNLDVPNLIYQLQLLYEGEMKGVVDAGTEEFRQLHKLLEDYNVMQQLLSTTIAAFDTSKTDDKRRFMNIGEEEDGDVDEKQTEYTPRNEDLGYLRDYRETYGGTSYINEDEHVPRYHWSLLANYSPDDDLSDLHRDFAQWNKDNDIDTGGNNYSDPGDVTGKLSRNEMLAFSMFADEAWASPSNRSHPIETLYGAERPKFDLIDEGEEGAGSLQLLSKNAFDQYQTQISNTITILNQQNQIKQNDVENATKEQNRHFELGSNALRKMNDLLLMIGRL